MTLISTKTIYNYYVTVYIYELMVLPDCIKQVYLSIYHVEYFHDGNMGVVTLLIYTNKLK